MIDPNDPDTVKEYPPVWMLLYISPHTQSFVLKKCGLKKKNSLSIFISLKKLFCADSTHKSILQQLPTANDLIDLKSSVFGALYKFKETQLASHKKIFNFVFF